ncbi:TPA: hypothetical protein ACVU40_002917 [Vibrio parahaemolyticus]|nr:hypothetical protein [Vibrio parahaemolyticus]
MKISNILLAALVMLVPIDTYASGSEMKSDALDLKMNVTIVPKDGQSMQTFKIGNIELFRSGKNGVTQVYRGKDFFLVYVAPSDGSSKEKPMFDVSFTYVSAVFDGENKPSGYVETMEPHKLFVMTTKDSDVFKYQFNNVELDKPLSQNKESSLGKSTRVDLELH